MIRGQDINRTIETILTPERKVIDAVPEIVIESIDNHDRVVGRQRENVAPKDPPDYSVFNTALNAIVTPVFPAVIPPIFPAVIPAVFPPVSWGS
jgi:hypothetical protein